MAIEITNTYSTGASANANSVIDVITGTSAKDCIQSISYDSSTSGGYLRIVSKSPTTSRLNMTLRMKTTGSTNFFKNDTSLIGAGADLRVKYVVTTSCGFCLVLVSNNTSAISSYVGEVYITTDNTGLTTEFVRIWNVLNQNVPLSYEYGSCDKNSTIPFNSSIPPIHYQLGKTVLTPLCNPLTGSYCENLFFVPFSEMQLNYGDEPVIIEINGVKYYYNGVVALKE